MNGSAYSIDEMKKGIFIMKIKMLLAAASLAGVMALTACGGSASSAAAPASKAAVNGTFSGKAMGMGGDVVVTLTIENDKITACEVNGEHETPGIGTPALEELPAKIVEANSYEVDAISGSTVTSNAIKEAAKAALAEAGL